jgi:peptide/nickel transport system substrate-binding protein
MQRTGFSIADSWKKAGFNVTARQADNGEFTTVQNTNAKLDLMVNWNMTCTYNSNWFNSWNSFSETFVKPVDSNEALQGNFIRVTDPEIFKLVQDSKVARDRLGAVRRQRHRDRQEADQRDAVHQPDEHPDDDPDQLDLLEELPQAANFYAAPYTWWSSFKKTIVNIEPTGK